MSEKTQDTNRTMLYLLGVVVVLLVVIVALVVFKGQGTTQPSTTTAPTDTGATTQQPTQAMPGVKPSSGGDFDVATATKVTAGVEPKKWVSDYYQAILDKKWDAAFKMQPAASQVGGTAKDFEQTQTSYGMKAFKIGSATVDGDTATVVAQQDLGANGNWTVTWTFVKSGSDWFVKSRQVAMGQ